MPLPFDQEKYQERLLQIDQLTAQVEKISRSLREDGLKTGPATVKILRMRDLQKQIAELEAAVNWMLHEHGMLGEGLRPADESIRQSRGPEEDRW